jgi:hypothetical protein
MGFFVFVRKQGQFLCDFDHNINKMENGQNWKNHLKVDYSKRNDFPICDISFTFDGRVMFL